jgi:response regulator RpfG family c-di-GMP phosphodiesterase
MNEQAAAATLLFVDDEASILASLRRLFRPHGYKILVANGGAEGIQALEREKVDLVISDMRMPEMDGAQFLEKVRSQWPGIVRILLTGYADIASTIAAINRGEIYRYIAKPWDDNEIVLTVRDALERQRLELENARLVELTQQQNEELKELNAGLEQKVADRTAQLRQTLTSLEKAHQALNKSFMTSVKVFSGLMELRGGRLAGHSRRVAEYARAVALRMDCSEQETQDILLASLLHDIGKIGLPDDLLDKPFNVLTGQARAEVMKHPLTGHNVLMGVDQLHAAALIVRHHHEYYDGSGYPDRLAAIAIPLGARILAVANEYDAVQLGTLTQRALNSNEALAFLIENRGRRYDPAVIDAFSRLQSESNKQTATEMPLRPAQLQPGMILARDLNHRDGYLLLARDHTVDAAVIRELRRLEDSDNQPLLLYIRQESS